VTDVLTIAEFRAHLASAIGREPAALPFGVDLRTEADLDSIEMFLLVIAAEDLGARFPEELLQHVRTIEDAYHYVVTQAGHR
jgi:acyl carrier protein